MMRFVGVMLFLATSLALAHGEDGEEGPGAGFECEHPPEEAVATLSGVIGTVGSLICVQSGQMIVASDRWSWRYPGSFFDMPFIPAYAHVDSRGTLPPFYFVRISSEELPVEQAKLRSDNLAKEIPTYRPTQPPVRMAIVKAENNHGQVIEILMPMQSDEEGWAIVCTPQCAPEYVIMLNKRVSQ